MNAILLYLLEVNIIVTVVYLAYRLLLSRDTHFQWRRAFMLAGVTVALSCREGGECVCAC